MTREEAIKIIDCYDIGFYDLSGEKIPANKLADAFDMAISALSAEQTLSNMPTPKEPTPIYDYMVGKTEQVTSKLKNPCDSLLTEDSADSKEQKSKLKGYSADICIIDEPNEVIEKNDEVINHDREWIIGCIKHDGFIKTDRFDKANQIILEALEPTEPSDLISRAEAINHLQEYYDYSERLCEEVEKLLTEVPSVSAEPIVVKCKIAFTDEDFTEWARKLRKENPNQNIVVIPYNAECVDYVPLNAVELTEEAKAKMKGDINP